MESGGSDVESASKIGYVAGLLMWAAVAVPTFLAKLGGGLTAIAVDQLQPVAIAWGGVLIVIFSVGGRIYVGWRQMRRDQDAADLDARIELIKRANAANVSLESLAGHVEQGAKEREILYGRMDRVEAALLTLAKACNGCQGATSEKVVECLAPTADGQPGCHGLGADHSPLKPAESK